MLEVNEGNHLLRSQDQGRTWDPVGGNPAGDKLLELVEVQGTVVARSSTTLWWTVDQGQSWQKQPLPAEIVDMVGGERLILVGDGIWAGSPERLSREEEGVFVGVGPGPVVVGADGGIWRAEPEWTLVATLPGAMAALGAGDQLYALDAQRRIFRFDGSWTACAEVEERGVFSMATDGNGGLLAGGADFAPYYSGDGCRSWERRDPPEAVIYDVEGGDSGPLQAYPVLLAAGERWLVAGWFGLWHSEDQGQSWLDAPVTPSDFIRGLAVAGTRVYKGGYSYGIAFSDDDGQTFSSPNQGMIPANAQIILPRPGTDRVYAVVNHRGWTSLDAGVHWEAWPTSDTLDHIRSWALLSDGSLVVDAKTGVWFTQDEGDTLQSRSDLDLALDGEPVVGVASFLGTGSDFFYCVATETRLLCLPDGATEFRTLYHAEGPLTAPVAGPDGIWVGGPTGLHRVSAAGSADVPVPVPPEKIFVSAGGSLYLTTAAAEVYQRRPGDVDWRRLGQLTAPIAELVEDPSREFSLLLGTHDGVWRLDEVLGAEPVLGRWGAWERLDGSSEFLRWFPEKPGALAEEEADFGAVHPLRPGSEVRAWLRGRRLQIRGRSRAGAQVLLRLDGEPVATLGHEGSEALRVLWASDDLAEGWHQIELVGVEGGLAIDSLDGCTGEALAACREETPDAPPPPPPAEKNCGCTNNGSASLLIGVFGILRRRQKRR